MPTDLDELQNQLWGVADEQRGPRVAVQSLCGSGLVDLIAAWAELGWAEAAAGSLRCIAT